MPHDDHVEELFYSVPDDTTRQRSQNLGREATYPDPSVISSLQVTRSFNEGHNLSTLKNRTLMPSCDLLSLQINL